MKGSLACLLLACVWVLEVVEVRSQACLTPQGEKHLSCTACLSSAGPRCGWCLDRDEANSGLAVGCLQRSSSCNTWYPVPGDSPDIIRNTNIGQSGNTQSSVFIQPQEMSLKLRPNTEKEISFKARRKQNALDMYFLLDLSGSMENYRRQLEQVPEELIKFGYGAFREKSTIPMSPLNISPSFEHLQNLTKNTEEVKRAIRNSKTKNNWDSPEAGLDGLMQVLLCQEEVGWRKETTRIIVFITDAPCHIAGDGIMAGIWKPFEHQCSLKLSSDGSRREYEGLDYDYPSLSEVDFLLNAEDTHLVFGVPNAILPLYEMFVREKVISHASVGNIGAEGESLKKIIEETYEEVDGQMQVQASVTPQAVKRFVTVSLRTDHESCTTEEEDEVTCRDVTVSDDVHFTAVIRLDPQLCQVITDRTLTINIRVFGQNSKLSVAVGPVCECDGSECRGDDNSVCNRLDSQAVNTCGSCVCDQMVGETCQCSKGGGGGGALEECQAPSDDRECSGQGNCQCGQCQCNKGWVGEYCECSKGSLDCGQQERRDLGLPADRGQHVCNNGTTECQCRADWSGPALQPACACSSHTDRCRVGGSSEEDCSGRGKCQCNKCQCEQGFSGSFCQLDLSKDLEQDTCDRMAPCVLHQIYGTNQSVPADKREEWRAACMEGGKLDCYISYTTGQTNNNAGDITTDEANNSGDLGLPCALREIDIDGGFKECHIPLEFSDCLLDVRHTADTSGLDGDQFYRTNKKVEYYVTFANDTEDPQGKGEKSPIPRTRCPPKLDWMAVILYSVGSGCGLFAIGFISYFLLINVKDYMELRDFEKNQKGIWDKGDVMEAEMRNSAPQWRKSLRSRLSVKFSNQQ